jgi:hypothetical protein
MVVYSALEDQARPGAVILSNRPGLDQCRMRRRKKETPAKAGVFL